MNQNKWLNFLTEQHTFSRSYSDNIYNVIKQFEGYSSFAYDDACVGKKDPNKKCGGNWTIGYGLKDMPNGTPVKQGDVLAKTDIEAKKVAETLYKEKLDQTTNELFQNMKVDLNQNQFDALLSVLYNMGLTKFMKTDLYRLVNENPNNPKIKQAILSLVKDNRGETLPGLVKRREFDAQLYFDQQGTQKKEKPTKSIGV